MEKQGVIKPGITPPESEDKQASDLESHVSRRAVDAVVDKLSEDARQAETR